MSKIKTLKRRQTKRLLGLKTNDSNQVNSLTWYVPVNTNVITEIKTISSNINDINNQGTINLKNPKNISFRLNGYMYKMIIKTESFSDYIRFEKIYSKTGKKRDITVKTFINAFNQRTNEDINYIIELFKRV